MLLHEWVYVLENLFMAFLLPRTAFPYSWGQFGSGCTQPKYFFKKFFLGCFDQWDVISSSQDTVSEFTALSGNCSASPVIPTINQTSNGVSCHFCLRVKGWFIAFHSCYAITHDRKICLLHALQNNVTAIDCAWALLAVTTCESLCRAAYWRQWYWKWIYIHAAKLCMHSCCWALSIGQMVATVLLLVVT